ncbi:hypothetical protein HanHA300_Chr16g0600051 [Helianthus annuus]|nr:hypothetical protein HanHA300_Chr16g0600051 [Helianthus annuus]
MLSIYFFFLFSHSGHVKKKKQCDGARLIISATAGIIVGYLIGINFPYVALTKVEFLATLANPVAYCQLCCNARRLLKAAKEIENQRLWWSCYSTAAIEESGSSFSLPRPSL